MKKKPQEELLAKLKYQYFTANTPLNRDLLNQQLEEARENGYYINYSEFHDATNAISAPVFDAADICGSITVVGTAEELPPDRMPEVARRLKIISRHVTLKLIDMHWITHPS
jgi:DNA-binding IclR family transcriptional regulator